MHMHVFQRLYRPDFQKIKQILENYQKYDNK